MDSSVPHFIVHANEVVFDISKPSVDAADIVKIADGQYHMIRDSQTVQGLISEVDSTGKKIRIELDGETFLVDIKDELDQMLEKMGFNEVAAKRIHDLKAPMPGLVLQINIQEGQQVKEGEKILILEAMKMENSILIQSDAVIKKILVTAGQAVEKGQVLVELE